MFQRAITMGVSTILQSKSCFDGLGTKQQSRYNQKNNSGDISSEIQATKKSINTTFVLDPNRQLTVDSI
jgi:hypothetical protein